MTTVPRAALAATLALFTLAPIAATAQDHGGHGAMSDHHGTARGGVDEAMDRMMEDMHAVEPTGDADADFLLLMIPHHQSAVDMTRALLPEIDDPEVAALARTIVESQEAEIAQMRAMLERLGHDTAAE